MSRTETTIVEEDIFPTVTEEEKPKERRGSFKRRGSTGSPNTDPLSQMIGEQRENFKSFIETNQLLNTNTFNSTNMKDQADVFVESFW